MPQPHNSAGPAFSIASQIPLRSCSAMYSEARIESDIIVRVGFRLLDQTFNFGRIGSMSLVPLGHCWSLTSSPEMTNTSANHYHNLRLIGRILQPCALFSQCAGSSKGHVSPSIASFMADWLVGCSDCASNEPMNRAVFGWWE